MRRSPSFTRLRCALQFFIDCARLSSLPDVTFVLGGEEYTFTAEQYIRRVGHVTLFMSDDIIHVGGYELAPPEREAC